jgi:hypothetical protein
LFYAENKVFLAHTPRFFQNDRFKTAIYVLLSAQQEMQIRSAIPTLAPTIQAFPIYGS